MTLKTQADEEVVVVGAGVIGLTVALRLQELGHRVLIIAKDFPVPFETIDPVAQINYTSPWAGAHNGWGRDLPSCDASHQEMRDHGFALQTFERISQIHAEHAEAGINIIRGFEYFDDPPDHIRDLSMQRAAELGIEDFQLLPKSKLPHGVKLGYSFRTWSLNPMVYCCFLLRRFTVQGGKIQKRELRSPNEVLAMTDFRHVKSVVNASGIGFGDGKVFITRGQTCLVANKVDVSISRHHADGTTSFCIPRNFDGGCIVGGTHEPHNWDPVPTAGLRDKMLKRLALTYPPILGESGKFVPLADVVGRRPTRQGGLRLEKEDAGDGKSIVHAYGAGGRGYELSWGVADLVGSMIGSDK